MNIQSHADEDFLNITIDDAEYTSDELLFCLEKILNRYQIRFETTYTGQQTVFAVPKSAFEQQDFQKEFVWMTLCFDQVKGD